MKSNKPKIAFAILLTICIVLSLTILFSKYENNLNKNRLENVVEMYNTCTEMHGDLADKINEIYDTNITKLNKIEVNKNGMEVR